ncbi:probable GPI-anchored adhesin-like protein PGA55 [Aristolochia californica]|uniref:probable GPI-anchored adhesin-like protein PGA55 n=1 Tax=Aristolochia californica TaxID=171875 RepID=UPI0035E09735
MIQLCTCTGRSASTFEIGKNCEVSLPCKHCGGRTVDGKEAIQGSMLSTVGLELTRVIDPDLTWRTVANRKGRRARTSLTATNKKKPNPQSLRNRGDLVDRSSKEVEDMPVSESEKLGVTILGRRFSDTLENLPIKKRKFMLVRPPSPPSRTSSSLSEDSAGSTKNSNFEQHDMVNGKTNLEGESEKAGCDLEGESEKVGGDADFSGISILATAACNSNRGSGISNANNSEVFPRIPQTIESNPVEISDKNLEECSGLSGDKSDLNGCADIVKKSDHVETMKDLNKETGTTGRLDSSSSRDDRSHWDLNTVMDEWDSPEDDEDNLENKENVEFRVTDSLSCITVQKIPSVMPTETPKLTTTEYELKLEMQSDPSACSQGKRLNGKVEDILNGDMALANGTGVLHNHDNSGMNVEAIPASVSVGELIENHSAAVQCLNFDLMNRGQSMQQDANLIQENNISEPSSNVVFADKSDLAWEVSPGNTINEEQRAKTLDSQSYVSISLDSEKGSNKDSDSLIPEPAKVTCSDVDLLKNGEASSCPQSCDASSFLGSFDSDKLHMASPCVGEGETLVADSKTSIAASLGTQIDAEALLRNPTSKTTNVATVTSDLKSSETCKSDGDLPKSYPVEAADPCESDFSDVSQNDGDHAMGLEKEALPQGADEESQYEDGEFREPTLHCWGDVGDEGEAEQVDYGSDNRDMDVFETPADCGVSSSLQCEGDEAVAQEIPVDQPSLPSSSRIIQLETQSVNTKKTLKVVKKILKGNFEKKEGSQSIGTTTKIGNEAMVEDEAGDKHGGGMGSSQTVNARMKSTGWDQLPDIHNSSEEAREESSTVVVVKSSLGKELPSRVEGPRSSDTLLVKDTECVHGSRSNDREVSNSRLETSASPRRSTGRGGSSMHVRGRGRGSDHWLDSSGSHWGPKHCRSPGYYGPSDFGPSGPKNNAAAAAAKVESSGFLVAPDGTIVKAGGMGPTGRGNRQSTNTSSQGVRRRGSATDRDGGWNFGKNIEFGPSREMSPDHNVSVGRGRPTGYTGTRVVNTSHRERYNGPVSDESFDMQHPLTHREGSFSPIHRRPLRLSRSRTKSRSRSRSRSPHMWASSRGRRSGGRVTGGPGFQRHSRSPPNFRSEARIEGGRSPQRRNSRSPNFWPEARIERMRSPHWRPGFSEHIGFVPTSRNHKSPPHASRWMDDRKDAPDHFREQDYKRSSVSERSPPPPRIFSRNQRFHVMGSLGRMKPDEYYRPIHSGRYPEFVGADRGPRHEGSDEDRRKHSDRYGMVHPIRHHDVEGDVKRFRYEFDNGFRAQNPHTKSGPDFHGRGSPRDYGRGIESRLGDGSRRGREEKDQFRYSREGKHSSSFGSYGVRECEEDLALRRRRPS